MTKTERLKQMYKDLAMGKTIRVNNCEIWRAKARNGRHDYFFWQCYGRAAEPVTMRDLRWICKVIADSKDYEYTIIY